MLIAFITISNDDRDKDSVNGSLQDSKQVIENKETQMAVDSSDHQKLMTLLNKLVDVLEA